MARRNPPYTQLPDLTGAVERLCAARYEAAFGKPWTPSTKRRLLYGYDVGIQNDKARELVDEVRAVFARVGALSEAAKNVPSIDRGLVVHELERWYNKHKSAADDLPKVSDVPSVGLSGRDALLRNLTRGPWRPRALAATDLAAVSILCGFMPNVSLAELRAGISAEDVLQKEGKYVRLYLSRMKTRRPR